MPQVGLGKRTGIALSWNVGSSCTVRHKWVSHRVRYMPEDQPCCLKQHTASDSAQQHRHSKAMP